MFVFLNVMLYTFIIVRAIILYDFVYSRYPTITSNMFYLSCLPLQIDKCTGKILIKPLKKVYTGKRCSNTPFGCGGGLPPPAATARVDPPPAAATPKMSLGGVYPPQRAAAMPTTPLKIWTA